MRSRITELRQVKASDLLPDPRNWRGHPKRQRDALKAMLDEVGIVDAVIARETPDGLMLIDGHLRADIDPDATLPCLIVDLDEDEAGQVLATLDPLAAMAEASVGQLRELVQEYSPPISWEELVVGLTPAHEGMSTTELQQEWDAAGLAADNPGANDEVAHMTLKFGSQEDIDEFEKRLDLPAGAVERSQRRGWMWWPVDTNRLLEPGEWQDSGDDQSR